MVNFLIQILISFFIGGCFIYLAKRFDKSQILYFFIGFFTCLLVRILYLIFYGFLTDFEIDEQFNFHKNLSIIISIVIAYITFMLIKKYLQKQNVGYKELDEIGKP